MDEWFRFSVGMLVMVIALVAVAVFGARGAVHHLDVNTCQRFGQESAHETRFIDYHFWDWDCLVLLGNGKWVPVNYLRGVDG
jgi:hypothetical protein